MNRFGAFLLGLALGTVLAFVTLRYHVVRANDSFHLVPRQGAQLDDLYVDIREFDLKAWKEHRSLMIDIIAAKKENLISDSATNSISKRLDNLFGDVEDE
jgi:hypothetical protein